MPEEQLGKTAKELEDISAGINVQSTDEIDQDQASEDLEEHPAATEDLEDGAESNESLEDNQESDEDNQGSNEEQDQTDESAEDLGEQVQESNEEIQESEENLDQTLEADEELEEAQDDVEVEETQEADEELGPTEEDAEEIEQTQDADEEVEQIEEDAEEQEETQETAEEQTQEADEEAESIQEGSVEVEETQEAAEVEQIEETSQEVQETEETTEVEHTQEIAEVEEAQETTEEVDRTQEAAEEEETQEAAEVEQIEETSQEVQETEETTEVEQTPEAADAEQTQESTEVEQTEETSQEVQETEETTEVEQTQETAEVEQTQEASEVEQTPETADAEQTPEAADAEQTQEAAEVEQTQEATEDTQETAEEEVDDVQVPEQSQMLAAEQLQSQEAAEELKASVDGSGMEQNPEEILHVFGQPVQRQDKGEEEGLKPIIAGVNPEQYQDFAKELLELIVHYKTYVHLRPPVPDVEPGFLRKTLPGDPPQDPEPFSAVLQDVQDVIMKGIVNHQSPFFHGYYPLFGSGASRLGSMLQEAFGYIASKWTLGPSVVELEMHVLEWLVKSMGLPDFFLFNGQGGGILVTSTSESSLIALCAARNKKIKEIMASDSSLSAHEVHGKLVAYSSQEAHFCHEKMTRYAAVKHHQIPVEKGEHMAMTGTRLHHAMDEDRKKGLIPFYVCNTLGTTSTCAFDKLAEIGPLCTEYGCWLHVDAAYAGSAFLCPEFRHYLQGVEHADSLSINFYKWMLVGLSTCGFWVKDSSCITREFGANAAFFKDSRLIEMPNYVDWQLHTCKNSRSLQLWFVIRLYGIKGLQQHIRSHVKMAQHTAKLLEQDEKFTIVHPPSMGLVCFKLKDQPDSVNKRYLEMIEKDRRIFLIGSYDADGFFLRISMNGEKICPNDMQKTISILDELADKCIQSIQLPNHS